MSRPVRTLTWFVLSPYIAVAALLAIVGLCGVAAMGAVMLAAWAP